jgi:hypothetical protein
MSACFVTDIFRHVVDVLVGYGEFGGGDALT